MRWRCFNCETYNDSDFCEVCDNPKPRDPKSDLKRVKGATVGNKKKPISVSKIGIGIGPLLVLVFILFQLSKEGNEPSIHEPNSVQKSKTVQIRESEEIIKNFLVAENNRNIDEIMTFYSTNVGRYWNLINPSHEEIRKQYSLAWVKTHYATNGVIKYEKTGINSFIFSIEFTYHLKKSNIVKQDITKVYFRLSDGKITETYGL